MQTEGRTRALFRLIVIGTITTLSLLISGCDRNCITLEELTAIDKAYTTAEKSINTHANAIKEAILAKKAQSREVADEITGYRAVWKRIKGEEELKKHVDKVISEKLISAEWSLKLTSREAASFIVELRNIEDELAREAHCPALSVTDEHGKPITHSSLTPEDLKLTDAMQKQLLTDLISFIGAEAATQLVVSTGIIGTASAFSWSTLGISLGVGIIVDVIARWFMDPAEKVALQLDDALNKAAEEQSNIFREAMKKHLDARRAVWIKEISQN